VSEKTEQPTAKKQRDARQKGQVAKSKDFTQNALLVALFAYVVAQGRQLVEDVSRLLMLPMAFIGGDFHQALSTLFEETLLAGARLLLPFLGIVLLVGIFAEAIQTGVLFSFEAIKPSAKKLDIVANAANIFSKKNLIEFLKSLLKIAILSWVIEALIVEVLPRVMYVPYRGIAELGELIGALLKALIIQTGVTTTVIALADLIWQRRQHTQGLMMSKDEIKQEYKGAEGDPHIKSQRKQLHQELLAGGAVESARQASVVVTNPTHLAIAIRYDEGEMPLPMVTGKGEGALAERMIAAAREAGVPVMQNIPLAHSLFREAAVDQYIPSDLIEPVAAVLRLVRQLTDQPPP
jgi:type III secretion protein U